MWNLEKWQSRNTDVQNKLMDPERGGESGMKWKIGINIYTLLIVC